MIAHFINLIVAEVYRIAYLFNVTPIMLCACVLLLLLAIVGVIKKLTNLTIMGCAGILIIVVLKQIGVL